MCFFKKKFLPLAGLGPLNPLLYPLPIEEKVKSLIIFGLESLFLHASYVPPLAGYGRAVVVVVVLVC